MLLIYAYFMYKIIHLIALLHKKLLDHQTNVLIKSRKKYQPVENLSKVKEGINAIQTTEREQK